MGLENLMKIVSDRDDLNQNKQGLSELRLRAQLNPLRNLVSFYREYPDILVDRMKGEESTFRFFFYQRVFLRIVMRHRYVYATFPRGYSKSFLSMMALMIRCILYPNSNLFVTTGGKELMRTRRYCEVA